MKASKIRLVRAFVHSCWDIFDHLGYWIRVNFVSCLGALFIFPIPFILMGLLHSQKKIIQNENLIFKDFLRSCRQYGTKAFLLFSMHLILILLGVLNSSFYHSFFKELGPFFDLLILFFELFAFGIFFFGYPLLLLGHSLKDCLKFGFILSIKYLPKIIIASVFALIFIFLCSVTVAAVFVFMLAALCSFWGNIFDQVSRIEEAKEERPLPEKTFKEIFFPFHY